MLMMMMMHLVVVFDEGRDILYVHVAEWRY